MVEVGKACRQIGGEPTATVDLQSLRVARRMVAPHLALGERMRFGASEPTGPRTSPARETPLHGGRQMRSPLQAAVAQDRAAWREVKPDLIARVMRVATQ